jgi:hypothetical protein
MDGLVGEKPAKNLRYRVCTDSPSRNSLIASWSPGPARRISAATAMSWVRFTYSDWPAIAESVN